MPKKKTQTIPADPSADHPTIRRMFALESALLHKAGYDPHTQTLILQFGNLAAYQYSGVPADVYCNLLNAESVGKFFHDYIKKPDYPCVKILDADPLNARSKKKES